MKKIIISIMVFVFLIALTNAQSQDYKSIDNICYCTGNSPSSIVKLDNNWELLLALRESKNSSQLDSVNLNYTFSQLRLMEDWDLIIKEDNGNYHTSINILDSITTRNLRKTSVHLSATLIGQLIPDITKLKSHLKSIDREANMYSILFSYIIDGMVWDYLENTNLIETRELSVKNPFWDGEFWTLFPKREFYCGTNSISDNRYVIMVNWSEKAIPNMIPFVNRFDLQGEILNDFMERGKVSNKEALEVFGKFNFFDENGYFTAPVIQEKEGNPIYSISSEMAYKITNFIKSNIDIDTLKDQYVFITSSQTLIILYHEMIWDIMKVLEKEGIVEKPIAFENPDLTKPADIGNLIILIKK